MAETILAALIMIVILGTIFLIGGIFFTTFLGNRLKNWLGEKILSHIPFFQTITGLTRQLTGVEKENYAVVEVDLYHNRSKTLGLLTETLNDGRCVIYVPFAPLVSVGQVYIVEKENVKYLNISI